MSWFQAAWLGSEGAVGESEAGGSGKDLAGAEVGVGAKRGRRAGRDGGDREPKAERRQSAQRTFSPPECGQCRLRLLAGALPNVQPANLQLADLQSADRSPADREATYAEPSDRKAADGSSTHRQRRNRDRTPRLRPGRRSPKRCDPSSPPHRPQRYR